MIEQKFLERIAAEVNAAPEQVAGAVQLFDKGATVPFVARYRKDQTGNLDEARLEKVEERNSYFTALTNRRNAVLENIAKQEKLTPELRERIEGVFDQTELEDLYLPFKKQRRTKASIAREQGLEPLADHIWAQDTTKPPPQVYATEFVDTSKLISSAEEALLGAYNIVAERVSVDPHARGSLRKRMFEDGVVTAAATKNAQGQKNKFEEYHDFSEPLAKIPAHRLLAVLRGARMGFLRMDLRIDDASVMEELVLHFVKEPGSHYEDHIRPIVEDSYKRLLRPSIENEVISAARLRADEEAVQVFRENVGQVLLSPPAGQMPVVGIDPGMKSGCKVAVVDKHGNFVEHALIYLVPPKPGPAAGAEEAKSTDQQQSGADPKEPVQEAPSEQGAAPEEAGAATVQAESPESSEAAPAEASSQAPSESPADPAETVAEPREADAETGGTAAEPAAEAAPAEATAGPEATAPEEEAASAEPAGKKEDAPPEQVPPVFVAETPEEGGEKLLELMQRHGAHAVAIGNGTGSREVSKFVDAALKRLNNKRAFRAFVNEAGASIYSASKTAREEFPNLDVTVRGAVSIARRLQDPLAELVKIEPRSIGVGQYQHDVNQRRLREGLYRTVESCVNQVGVDLNTASVDLLRYVSGIQMGTAQSIVEFRKQANGFQSREQLKEVSGIGEKTFEQCAGFLRVSGGANPLDATAIHPEAYPVVERMAESLSAQVSDIVAKPDALEKIDMEQFATETVGKWTLADIRAELKKPGRDPRRQFRVPRFAEGVYDIADLEVGLETEGVVTNITDFGAFVDIGVHQDGLIHLSELANRFVKDPHEIVRVGDIVPVKVIKVDQDMRRISLSRKALLTPRRPRKRQQERGEQESAQRSGRQGGARPQQARGGEGPRKRRDEPPRGKKGKRPERRKPGKRGKPAARTASSGDKGDAMNTQLADQLAALKEKFK